MGEDKDNINLFLKIQELPIKKKKKLGTKLNN